MLCSLGLTLRHWLLIGWEGLEGHRVLCLRIDPKPACNQPLGELVSAWRVALVGAEASKSRTEQGPRNEEAQVVRRP